MSDKDLRESFERLSIREDAFRTKKLHCNEGNVTDDDFSVVSVFRRLDSTDGHFVFSFLLILPSLQVLL